MNRKLRIAALLLCIAMLTGCAHNTIHSHILTGDKITPLDVTAEAAGDFTPVGDLGAKLWNSAVQSGEQNPVISPLSAYICLAMAMNGADGDTMAAFEQVMGADMYYVNLICRAPSVFLFHPFKLVLRIAFYNIRLKYRRRIFLYTLYFRYAVIGIQCILNGVVNHRKNITLTFVGEFNLLLCRMRININQ